MQFLNTVKQYRNLLVSIIIFILLTACQMTPKWVPYSAAAGEVYPKEKWQKVETPEKLGWSSKKLAEAQAYSKRIGSAAVMIVDNGVVVDAWGNTSRNFQCHSMRKSLISALIGIHVEEGNINLTKTMEELTIDDYEPSLTSEEKQATINDLIRARSGIYHAALGESQGMKATRPKRHSHPHGTFWYYNNWDFNTIGTIFEQETVTKIFEEFNRRLAKPLQMEDFKIRRCSYKTWRNYDEGKTSRHRYYLFRVSTRDLAGSDYCFCVKAGGTAGRLFQLNGLRKARPAILKPDQIAVMGICGGPVLRMDFSLTSM